MENTVSQIRKPCISVETFKQVARGDLITYLLPAHMRPANPLKEWHGRVKGVNAEEVLVSILDDGYSGCTEIVLRTEIISVMKSAK